eukprot:jgi/Botrbrau1/2988/Bobra.0026s0049.2
MSAGLVAGILPGVGLAPPPIPGVTIVPGVGVLPGVRPPAFLPGIIPGMPGAAPKRPAFQPAPLRLNEEGREVDEQGNVVARAVQAVTTLKINQKLDQLAKSDVPSSPPKPPPAERFYDDALGDKGLRKLERRGRRDFNFVTPGYFERAAENARLRAQFGDAAVQDAIARRKAERRAEQLETIDANLIPIGQPQPLKPEKPPPPPIPTVEWWDARILRIRDNYDGEENGGGGGIEGNIREDRITHYIEHPVLLDPPAEEPPPPAMPLMLTAKERKKLRTQRRLEREKEKQELIRQGLLEPPKPKIRISNMMRVLGSEAAADPTAIEQEVRQQMLERQQAHEDRNLARKLTPMEKKEKKLKKLLGDAEAGVATMVSVYRVRFLSTPQLRFKVSVNAEELHMTGCSVITDDMAIVVVEGGEKAQKRYNKLMLRRINWEQGRDDQDREAALPPNKCDLVWQGTVKKPAFDKFYQEIVRTEGAARKFLEERGIANFWDIAKALAQAEEPPL